MSNKTALKNNPAYEPPQTDLQPISQDTVIKIPNQTGAGKCPNCNVHGNVIEERVFSQKQHLLAVIIGLISCLCCIPYCIPSLKYTRHRCQSCGFTTKDHNKNVALKILLTIVVTVFAIALTLYLLGKFNWHEQPQQPMMMMMPPPQAYSQNSP